jgi:hypothetical protein
MLMARLRLEPIELSSVRATSVAAPRAEFPVLTSFGQTATITSKLADGQSLDAQRPPASPFDRRLPPCLAETLPGALE